MTWWPPSAAEWRKSDSEDCPTLTALVNQLALMLADDPIRHKEAKSRAALLGREVRFEEVVAFVVWDTRPIIGDAEVWPAIPPPAGLELHMAVRRNGIDRVVDEVRDYFAEEQRIGSN